MVGRFGRRASDNRLKIISTPTKALEYSLFQFNQMIIFYILKEFMFLAASTCAFHIASNVFDLVSAFSLDN